MTGGLREMVLLKETQARVPGGQTPDKKVDGDYFNSYDDVEVHRLMIRDKARTDAYERAITENAHYFKDKIVMDVGAGTGILSLFAMRAGAKKVMIEFYQLFSINADLAFLVDAVELLWW